MFSEQRKYFSLNTQFIKDHPLVGILLQQLVAALLDPEHSVRKAILHILRHLLAKHALDDRYGLKVCLIISYSN